MEDIIERFYIGAYNKINASIREFSKWEKEYPAFFDLSTAQLIKRLQIDKQNLSKVLRMINDCRETNKKRLVIIVQIQFIIDELQRDSFNQITPNQNLMIDNYIFPMIANLLGEIVYERYFFNSKPKFDRRPHSNFNYHPLCKLLRVMKDWLSDKDNMNYIDFENYMDEKLETIATMVVAEKAA